MAFDYTQELRAKNMNHGHRPRLSRRGATLGVAVAAVATTVAGVAALKTPGETNGGVTSVSSISTDPTMTSTAPENVSVRTPKGEVPIITDHNSVIRTAKNVGHIGYHGYEITIHEGSNPTYAMVDLDKVEGLNPKKTEVSEDINATSRAIDAAVTPSVTNGSLKFKFETEQPPLHTELLNQDPYVTITPLPSGKQ
jgi:hypothetical protein